MNIGDIFEGSSISHRTSASVCHRVSKVVGEAQLRTAQMAGRTSFLSKKSRAR